MFNCIVKINDGKLKGKIGKDYYGNNYYSFQGIPYAKPPLNNLRFKAPLPVEPWKFIKDATKEGNVCISLCDMTQNIKGSEDCLFLNVYTPQIAEDNNDLKPVMFWIHGGSFTSGSGGTELFGPEFLMTENIVLVTVNYRLGIFGFLSMEDPNLNVSGNAALKDLVMALKWVKNNVGYFCGNPDNVTIAGTSAGGTLVNYLLLSPMAKGLFHRAIIQSGSIFCPWSFGETNSKLIAKELGVKNKSEKELLEILKNLSTKEVFDIQIKILKDRTSYINKIHVFTPVIENSTNEQAFMNKHPVDIIKSGNYNKVPIIIGYTSHESLTFSYLLNIDPLNYNDFELAIPHFMKLTRNSVKSKCLADEIGKLFYGDSSERKDLIEKFNSLKSSMVIILGIYYTIKLMIQNLEHPIYLYKLAFKTKLNFMQKALKMKWPGTYHGDDIGYLFQTSFTPLIKKDSEEEICMRRLIKLWCNFARTGNPNEIKNDLISVEWKEMKSDQYNYFHIDKEFKNFAFNFDFEKLKHFNDFLLNELQVLPFQKNI